MTKAALSPRTIAIRFIQTGRRTLAMEEGAYRAMLQRVTGKESLTEMSDAELKLVSAELRRLGFGTASATSPGRKFRRRSDRPEIRKLYAFWGRLHRGGAVEDGSPTATDAWVEAQTGVSSTEWLEPDQARTCIQQLKAWGQRCNIDMES